MIVSADQLNRIDTLNDRFESSLRRDHEVRIEDFLCLVPSDIEQVLFEQLLRVEVELLSESKHLTAPSEYLRRFPHFEQSIYRILGKLDSTVYPTQQTQLANKTHANRQQTLVGTKLGNCELLDVIGAGGMGVVYQARDHKLDRFVAVKTIHSDLADNTELVNRFQREARAVSKLNHPGIIPVYQMGCEQGVMFFVMQYVAGGSLSGHIKRDGPMNPRRAAKLLEKVARAVHAAHQTQIVHRDLKPDNILLISDTHPIVSDFGLVKRINRFTGGSETVAETDVFQTITGAMVGTPSFMSPEQTGTEKDEVDQRSDVYSLGATLYFMLTGRPPLQSVNLAEAMRQIIEDTPVSVRKLDSAIPIDLETITFKCLEKSASKRYQSASDLADDLKRFDLGQPIEAQPISMPERSWRWCRRKPVAATLVATLTCLIVLTIFAARQSEQVKLSRALADSANSEKQVAEYFTAISNASTIITRRRPGWRSEQDAQLAEASQSGYPKRDRRALRNMIAQNGIHHDLLADPVTMLDDLKFNTVALHPTKPWIVAGQYKSLTMIRILVYDYEKREIVKTLTLPGVNLFRIGQQDWQDTTTDVAFSRDGSRLAALMRRGTLAVWDVQSWQRQRQPAVPNDGLLAFGVESDQLYVTGNSEIYQIDLENRQSNSIPIARPVNGIAVSSQTGELLFANHAAMEIWSADRQPAGRLEQPIVDVKVSADGRLLATLDQDCVKLLDPITKSLIGKIDHGFRSPKELQLSPDGRFVSVDSQNEQRAGIWVCSTGDFVGHLPMTSDLPEITFGHDDDLFVTEQIGIRRYKIHLPKLVRQWLVPQSAIDADWMDDGRIVCVSQSSGTIPHLSSSDTARGELTVTQFLSPNNATRVFSTSTRLNSQRTYRPAIAGGQNGRFAVATSATGITIHDESGSVVCYEPGSQERPLECETLEFDKSQNLYAIVVSSQSDRVFAWNRTGQAIAHPFRDSMALHRWGGGNLHSLGLGHQNVYVGENVTVVHSVDRNSMKKTATLTPGGTYLAPAQPNVTALAVMPHSRSSRERLIVGDRVGQLFVCDPTSRLVLSHSLQDQSINALEVDESGRLYSADNAGVVRAWTFAADKLRLHYRFNVPTGRVTRMEVHNGKMLLISEYHPGVMQVDLDAMHQAFHKANVE
ncbi:MAG: WD40 repeat domain-containing serine/threonine protein kinase [Rubripirellula sp.]